MNYIRWIQLSDLHFGDNSEFSHKSREALQEYIAKNHKNIDYIFVTGDIIFAKNLKTKAAKKKCYDEAKQYLENIYRSIWGGADMAENIEQRIFVVPGNHDLIRDDARRDTVEGMLKNYGMGKDGKIDSSYLKSFKDASSLFRTAYRNLFSEKGATLALQKVHYVKETDKINILHINTCIASSGDGDDGKLIIGFELLNKALSSISNEKPTIAIAHHNFDCLNTEEQKKLETLLKQKHIFLYLCGHAHARESNLILRVNQHQVINTFTCGTLMAEDGAGPVNTVFFVGEMNLDNLSGKIHSFKWDLTSGWHDDMEFGLAQSASRKENYRTFSASGFVPETVAEVLIGKGIPANIVTHLSPERREAFLEMNKRAQKSLSIYGIGITSVSKEKEMFDRILKDGGKVQLCMVDPDIFKSGVCKPGPDGTIPDCLLNDIKFCIYGEHMNEYMRDEYYEDMGRSYERLKKYKEHSKDLKGTFEVKILKSFIPLSINIINEDTEEAELIVEYSMPFTAKRLLMQLNQKSSGIYFNEIKEIFDEIWRKAVDFTW